jgi:hypothetical protein
LANTTTGAHLIGLDRVHLVNVRDVGRVIAWLAPTPVKTLAVTLAPRRRACTHYCVNETAKAPLAPDIRTMQTYSGLAKHLVIDRSPDSPRFAHLRRFERYDALPTIHRVDAHASHLWEDLADRRNHANMLYMRLDGALRAQGVQVSVQQAPPGRVHPL